MGIEPLNILVNFYTPPHDSGRVLWFHVGCPSVRPSIHQLSPRMGIYWDDMNLVLAIYSVSVESKYPINLRHLLGI